MTIEPEQLLPTHLLQRASPDHREYAWRVTDIPEVIETTRVAKLVSLGGQLQFRMPTGPVYEAYWVSVDPLNDLPEELPWHDRVERSATEAAKQFAALPERWDFLAAGREAFPEVGDDLLNEAMWFVWYVSSEEAYSNSTMT